MHSHDWDISLEEMYIGLIECEMCCSDVPPSQVHIMQSFKDGESDLIICPRCYDEMLGEKIIKD